MLQNRALRHCKQHDVGSVWIKHIKSAMIVLRQMKTVWRTCIWTLRILSKMAAPSWIIIPQWPLVSLFLRFQMNLNCASFRSRFPLSFAWKWFEINTMCTSVFSFISQRNKKNHHSILKWYTTLRQLWLLYGHHKYNFLYYWLQTIYCKNELKRNQNGILNFIGNRSDTLSNKNDNKLIILLNNYYNG